MKPYLLSAELCWGLTVQSGETCYTSFPIQTPFHPSQLYLVLLDLFWLHVSYDRRSLGKLWKTPERLETTWQSLLFFPKSGIFSSQARVFRIFCGFCAAVVLGESCLEGLGGGSAIGRSSLLGPPGGPEDSESWVCQFSGLVQPQSEQSCAGPT